MKSGTNCRTLVVSALALLTVALPVAARTNAAAAASHGPNCPMPAATAAAAHDPDSGAELLGTAAPALAFDHWLRTKPLDLASLRGRVVLLRWWTEGCPYCRTTLPALERVRTRDAGKGLVVIGVFHPKPPGAVSDAHVLAAAEKIGFHGPVAVDPEWKMLDRYWLAADPDRHWTSVSFLIDRAGRICWVQGGGEYHPSADPEHAACDATWRGFEKALAQALAENPRSS